MKLSILAGSTSQSVNVFIRDSSSTTGGGLAAVAPAGGSLLSGTKLYYSFTGTNASAGVAVSLSVLAAVNSAWSSAGIVTLDATNMIGWVRIDIPDAALAGSKGRVVSFHLYGGTNMAPTPFEIELTGWNNQDGVRGGMTALPNAAAEASGGLYTRGAGAGQLSQSANGELGVATLAKTVTTYTGDTPQTGDSFARIGATGSGLTSLAPSATALSTATWTNTLATNLTNLAKLIVASGTVVDGAPAANDFKTSLTFLNSAYEDSTCLFTSGVLIGQSKVIISCLATNGELVFDEAFTSAPGNGDSFLIIGTHTHTIHQTAIEVFDVLNTMTMTEAYAANGVEPTLFQMIYMIWSLINNRSISSTTLTAKKLDGTTTAMTFTLNDATNPTSQTRAT